MLTERLQQLAAHFEANQTDFAEMVGKTRVMVSRWFTGKNRPSKSSLRRIANATGCSLIWLTDGLGEMFPGQQPQGKIAATLTPWPNRRPGSRVIQPEGDKDGTKTEEETGEAEGETTHHRDDMESAIIMTMLEKIRKKDPIAHAELIMTMKKLSEEDDKKNSEENCC